MAKGNFNMWLDPENLLQLEAWARDGLINEQVAKNIGIATETLRVWSHSLPLISAALKRGKAVVDIQVQMPCINGPLAIRMKKPKKHNSKTVTARFLSG